MTEFEKKFKEKTGINFNKYYNQYKPKLTWYLTKYTKNIELAEEFANIAFVQSLEKIDSYDMKLSQFITWLTSIAVNIVIKDYKDKLRQNTTSLDYELNSNFTLNSILSYDDHSIENTIDKENIAKCNKIKDVIYSLPDKYKKVMIMREIDKKPYKEISESILKEDNIILNNQNFNLSENDYFHSAVISNIGLSEVKIKYNPDGYTLILKPNEIKEINKTDIYKKNIDILSEENTRVNIRIKETTNLSTIKSQIKKGRYLIRKKVKKDFDYIDKNGVD